MGETLPKLNFNILPADVEVGLASQRILFIGQMTAEGTATAEKLVQNIANDNSWDTLFGKKSVLANMIRRARKLCTDCGYQVAIDAIPLADSTEETASKASATITFAGTATDTSDISIVIGSEYYHKYNISCAKDATASQIATALKNKIDADTKAPFTASVSGAVVTITAGNTGTIYNNTAIYTEGALEGITTTITAFSGGAVDCEVDDDILALIEQLRYQAIVSPVEYGIQYIKTELDARFNTNNKVMDGVLFVDKTDTLANHRTALASLNSQNVHYQCDKLVSADNYKGSSVPEFSYIKATYNATMRALRVSEGSQLSTVVIGQYPDDIMGGTHNNSLPFFNSKCAYLNAIKPQYHWKSDEIKELNDNGGSVWNNNASDNGIVMGEQLTTYKTDSAGNEDITWKYLNYRDTESAVREYRFVNFKKDFAQSRMNDDTEKVVRNAFIKYYRALSSDKFRLLRSGKEALNFYKDNLKISLDFAKGQVTVYCLDPIVTQLRECIGYFKVTFSLETGEAVE